ncbi:hypothetical protein BC628DRAFT_1421469 [Trametes gibbosa]|nr:hypothetical protein BC628DRAFT_1421469 [Trametes gibbosa]
MVSFKSFALLAFFASLAAAVSVGREVPQGRSIPNAIEARQDDSTDNCRGISDCK